MLLEMLKAKIHRATVTGTDLNYEGSIAIDQDLLDAAGILPFEAVHVWNIATGDRIVTYAITAERGSGEVCLNGAAARHVQRGDSVIIATLCQLDEKEVSSHTPRIVLVDQANRVLSPIPAHGH